MAGQGRLKTSGMGRLFGYRYGWEVKEDGMRGRKGPGPWSTQKVDLGRGGGDTCTGRSWGATRVWALAALDPRITSAAGARAERG